MRGRRGREAVSEEAVGYLEEVIDLLDMLEKEISFLGPDVSPGRRFRMYQLVVDIREKVVASRMALRGFQG